MFNVGEEEAVDFEICDGKIFLCTDSGERHEIEQISDETKRVVVATIEKLAETVDVVKNKSPQGNSASEQSSNAEQGETVTASTADGNSPDNNLDNEELDQTGMAMLVDLKARVAGKSTPKIKKTIVIKSSKGKNNESNTNVLSTELEQRVDTAREMIQKEIELSEKVQGFSINLQERQLNMEQALFQKIAQLEAQNKKLEMAIMSESSSESSVRPQNVHLNREFISKTIRDEISHIKAGSGELDLSDRIQIEVSNKVGSGRREYKLTSEVTFVLFIDFLTSELTLYDLMYVIDSKITRKNGLSPEQLEKDKIRVRDIIINRIDMSYYTKVSHLRDPIELLKKIKELKFSETSITPSVLRKRLNSIKYQPHREKASEFWDRFDDLVRMYNRIPDVQKLTEIDIRDALFDAIVSALPGVKDMQFFFKHSASRLMTIDELKDYIIQQESYKLEQQEIERSSRPPPSARQAATRNDDRLCYTCGNKGHIAQDCTRKDRCATGAADDTRDICPRSVLTATTRSNLSSAEVTIQNHMLEIRVGLPTSEKQAIPVRKARKDRKCRMKNRSKAGTIGPKLRLKIRLQILGPAQKLIQHRPEIQCVSKDLIKVKWVRSRDQLADIFTKPLALELHNKLTESINQQVLATPLDRQPAESKTIRGHVLASRYSPKNEADTRILETLQSEVGRSRYVDREGNTGYANLASVKNLRSNGRQRLDGLMNLSTNSGEDANKQTFRQSDASGFDIGLTTTSSEISNVSGISRNEDTKLTFLDIPGSMYKTELNNKLKLKSSFNDIDDAVHNSDIVAVVLDVMNVQWEKRAFLHRRNRREVLDTPELPSGAACVGTRLTSAMIARHSRMTKPDRLRLATVLLGIGASPDGTINEDIIVEIKSSFTGKDLPIDDVLRDKKHYISKAFKNINECVEIASSCPGVGKSNWARGKKSALKHMIIISSRSCSERQTTARSSPTSSTIFLLPTRLPGRLAQVSRDSSRATLVRCLARSARSRRCIAPISASLPISRLNSTKPTRVREAKRPVVPKHGSPEGLEAASRQTRTSSGLPALSLSSKNYDYLKSVIFESGSLPRGMLLQQYFLLTLHWKNNQTLFSYFRKKCIGHNTQPSVYTLADLDESSTEEDETASAQRGKRCRISRLDWNFSRTTGRRSSQGMTNYWTSRNSSPTRTTLPRISTHLDPADFGGTSDRDQSSRELERADICPVTCSRSADLLRKTERVGKLQAALLVSGARKGGYIPRVAKLQYLLNAVQGQAALRLKGLEITAANFDVAWEKLLRRYDNQRIRLYNTLENLMQLPLVKSRTADELTNLIDRIEEAVRSLQELQCPVHEYDNWIVHCVVRNLDANSRESWEISQEDSSEFPKYRDLIVFLERRVRSLEQARPSAELAAASGQSSRDRGTGHRRISANTARVDDAPASRPGPLCDMCQTGHWLHKCFKFLSMSQQQRLELCKAKRFRTLSTSARRHRAVLCARHHTKLHADKPGRPKQGNDGVAEDSASVSAPVEEEHSGFINGFTTRASSEVLLATAMVHLMTAGGELLSVRALIDPAAERSFVTRRAASQLNLPERRTSMSIIGLGAAGTELCLQVLSPRNLSLSRRHLL
ncbi:unnamed protein product [Trichogramma brassicae]|uniref:CCHC-type domain-containing protein n=1 Tax=Trichogramma brassicae TaxID=86971 RepID=A0A6H5IG36_9HYME|nr:unnamed protein product [Trichogramma brassicae]